MNHKLIVLAGAAVLVLGGAVLTVARLLPAAVAAAGPGGGIRVIESVTIRDDGSGPAAPVTLRTTILPAPELAQSPPAASGLVLSRQGDRLQVGTGNIELEVDIKIDDRTAPDEQMTLSSSTDGPAVEVVVTAETAVFRDVTDFAPADAGVGGERQIQQVVEPVEGIGEVGPNMEIQVWGQRRGEQIVADVLVYGPLPGHFAP